MSARVPYLAPFLAFIVGWAGMAWSQQAGFARAASDPDEVRRTDANGDVLPPGAIARHGTLRLQHGGHVSNLLFTRDGKGLISAGGEAVIRLWDPATGKEIRHFA